MVLQLCLVTVLRNVELEQRKALLSPRGSHWIIHQNNKPDTGRDSGKNTEQRNSKKHQKYREIDRQRCAALQWFYCGACRGILKPAPACTQHTIKRNKIFLGSFTETENKVSIGY